MDQITCINEKHGPDYAAYHGETVSVCSQLPDNCIDFSIYSPPFSNIFVYSDSAADMGNCANDAEFFEQYTYLIKEKLRITKPGRLSAVHCSDLPVRKGVDGYIGIKDFSGDIVRAHMSAGWILHTKITIWRCPVVEMTRTKALGLLYKQLQKDSSLSRMGMPDYVMVFRKPGDNGNPIRHTHADLPVEQWQKIASPVWMDIQQSNTLNKVGARESADERHICPLQLDLIERALLMWSNPGDTVLSPFMGIGSEGFCSLKQGRKFIGVELKESYWMQACQYLDGESAQGGLF